MNVIAISVSLMFPWLLFTLIFGVVSFEVHYYSPALCWGLVIGAGLLVLLIGAISVFQILATIDRQRIRHPGGTLVPYTAPDTRSPFFQPTWCVFIFVTSLIAVIAAPIVANSNYIDWMQKYYDLSNLNEYTGVDPLWNRGVQMMDAGRVQFVHGATIDLSKAFAFKNQDTYCVAPITSSNISLNPNCANCGETTTTGNPVSEMGTPNVLGSYDFWAVGINCCNGVNAWHDTTTLPWDSMQPTLPPAIQALSTTEPYNAWSMLKNGDGHYSTRHVTEFKCGDYNSPNAIQGLRYIGEDDAEEERGFFRLAVQEAETAHMIKAEHPLFFHWTDDANRLMNTYLTAAFKRYATVMLIHFALQLCFVMGTAQYLSQQGYSKLGGKSDIENDGLSFEPYGN